MGQSRGDSIENGDGEWALGPEGGTGERVKALIDYRWNGIETESDSGK